MPLRCHGSAQAHSATTQTPPRVELQNLTSTRNACPTLQHGEAAEAAGDLGGFENFQDFLEGNEIGGGKDGTKDEEDVVDLYGAWDDNDGAGGDDDDDDSGALMDGSAITYADFFGSSAPYRHTARAADGRQSRHTRYNEKKAEADLGRQAAEQPHSGGDGSSGATIDTLSVHCVDYACECWLWLSYEAFRCGTVIGLHNPLQG